MLHRIVSSLGILSCTLTLFIPIVRAQVCTPPPTGLVAWYRAEGDLFDSSGSGNHGAGTPFTVAGHVGQAFSFSTQHESLVIPNNPSLFPLTALSIEGWIRPSNYANCSGSYRIFHTVQFEPLRGYATIVNCPNQKLIGVLFDPSGVTEAVTSNASIPADTFTHFAMTWDGSNLRLYINGALDNTVSTMIAAIGTNSDPIRISNSQALGFLGQIDEISLYNRALSGAEALSIFNSGTAGKCFAPTAAFVSIGGRAMNSQGRPIAKAQITLQEQGGNVRTALTNPFGYYSFDGIATGTTVMLNAAAKGQEFIEPTRVITVHEAVANIDFITVD